MVFLLIVLIILKNIFIFDKYVMYYSLYCSSQHVGCIMDNDPTIKLPPRLSGSLKSSENSRGDTSPTDSVPLQGLPESGQPALEYEYSWDQSAAHMPVASESSSPIPTVLSP